MPTTSNPSDRTCFPSTAAPGTTDNVCHCVVCGIQWASRGPADTRGCPFCGAPGAHQQARSSAVVVVSEKPNDYGAVIF